MQIRILMNEKSRDALAFEQVQQAIELKEQLIVTHCLDFAGFHYLDKGYDIEVVRLDSQTGKHTKIVLSELLDNNRPYCDKEIRRAHNIQKMIKGNALLFLPPVSETYFKVEYLDPVSKEKVTEHKHIEPLIIKGEIVASAKENADGYACVKADNGWCRVTQVLDTPLLS